MDRLDTCTRSNTIRLEVVGSYNLDSFLSYESEQEFGFWGVVVMSHAMVRRQNTGKTESCLISQIVISLNSQCRSQVRTVLDEAGIDNLQSPFFVRVTGRIGKESGLCDQVFTVRNAFVKCHELRASLPPYCVHKEKKKPKHHCWVVGLCALAGIFARMSSWRKFVR